LKIHTSVLRGIAGTCLALLPFPVSGQALAQSSTSNSADTLDRNAYLHYLLALRFANDGIPYAALHEAAASLRIQANNNPAAGLTFHLITSQRQDTHLRLCCSGARIIEARYSADGTRILTALDDRTVRVWDAATGRLLYAPLKHDGDILAVAWSVDGKRIVSTASDGSVSLWDAANGKSVRSSFHVEQPITHVAISPNGDFVVGSHGVGVSLWDVRTGAVISPKPYHDDISAIEFSNDGKYAVIATNDDAADIVDATTAKRLHRLSPGNAVFHAVFSGDSHTVLTASEDRTAQIWDVSTGTAKGGAFRQDATVSDAEFSRDGSMVLTTSYDHTARVWSAQTGKPITPLLQHGAPVISGGFSGDGSVAFTRSRDNSIRLWHVATGEPIATPIAIAADHSAVQFNPTGLELMVATGNVVEIMDVAPGEATPAWLADLADFEASRSRFDQAPVHGSAAIEKLQKAILASKDADPWTTFAQWYFSTPQQRTVSPWSKVPLRQYVDDLIEIDTADSLAYAEKISAGHPAWLLRVAEKKKLPRASIDQSKLPR
jgi:WD40 repeat protein